MRSIEHLGPGVALFAGASSEEAAIRAGLGGGPRHWIPSVRLPCLDTLMGRMIEKIVVNPSARTSAADARLLAVADGSFDEDKARSLARVLRANETWQCPTLIRMHTQAFPDSPAHLHDELDLLAEAGLGPLRILQAATSAAARFFGLTDVAGAVAVGRNADLVVLDADPVTDHAHLHGIAGVMRDGGWWSRADLDGVLARVEADPRTF